MNATPAPLELTVYLRVGCDLCDVMLDEIEPYRARAEIVLRPVDIDADPALVERYDTLVPVLAHGEREICRYFFDPDRLDAFMAERGRG